ncbi:hypothetical protein HQQ94_13375 [Shewanella sp. VB17]|uniref:hypothetical protein n=1 Tax=Shewanella sp. VB17 TaxID=2739432 RepID=UPI00156347EA|nr:hypothetical protein [Shewanella sp. VB17]NRD74209.1 hypothetical protein [Shewanella sp. VB17]
MLKANGKAHAVEAHGAHVSEAHIQYRASEGIAPDGKDTGIPTISSKFESKELMIEALNKVKPGSAAFKQQFKPDVQNMNPVNIIVDMGKSVGHGYRGKKSKDQIEFVFVPSLTQVTARYKYNENKGEWFITTMFPSKPKG